ncbi:hypothetical protein MRB53_029763 [Persea americana]|uniref:Uncharacterized protein n=1 Tax=Persea americana TaxID=3435 RepID=A0ACC2KJE0_PERAE|nr:hypothetical protein MRB53_029763 [Persea americana]
MAEPDIEKPLLGPENFNRDAIDLERIPLEEVFEQLRTSQAGLSSTDAEARLIIFGPNKLEEKPVLRDGEWQEQDAAVLVPGDIISIKLGDIIPADARLLEGDPLKIDQANAS